MFSVARGRPRHFVPARASGAKDPGGQESRAALARSRSRWEVTACIPSARENSPAWTIFAARRDCSDSVPPLKQAVKLLTMSSATRFLAASSVKSSRKTRPASCAHTCPRWVSVSVSDHPLHCRMDPSFATTPSTLSAFFIMSYGAEQTLFWE